MKTRQITSLSRAIRRLNAADRMIRRKHSRRLSAETIEWMTLCRWEADGWNRKVTTTYRMDAALRAGIKGQWEISVYGEDHETLLVRIWPTDEIAEYPMVFFCRWPDEAEELIRRYYPAA